MLRVYITGMGALTSLGLSVDETFENLTQGKSGVKAFPEWAKFNGLHSHLGAAVPAYDIMKVPRTSRRTMSRMSEMATLATFQALAQADLAPEKINSERTLIIMGSTSGSPQTLEVYFRQLFDKGGPQGQVSTSFFKVMNHSVPANVAAAIGFEGAMLSPSSACSTSTQAMILGWELMQTGLYDCVIAGGADELHYMSAAIFDIVLAASRGFNQRPDMAPRPFDAQRDGLVVSEGAGVLIMESEKRVKERSVRPLAEVNGGAYYCDGSHMSQSSCQAMKRTIELALKRTGIAADSFDYINAHGTATVQGDAAEASVISEVFGSLTPVSSLKGHLGHSLAACGAIEAIASVQMMENEVLVPTRNLENPDPACAGVNLLRELKPAKVRRVLSNNFAFGGMNTSLVLSKVGRDYE